MYWRFRDNVLKNINLETKKNESIPIISRFGFQKKIKSEINL